MFVLQGVLLPPGQRFPIPTSWATVPKSTLAFSKDEHLLERNERRASASSVMACIPFRFNSVIKTSPRLVIVFWLNSELSYLIFAHFYTACPLPPALRHYSISLAYPALFRAVKSLPRIANLAWASFTPSSSSWALLLSGRQEESGVLDGRNI
jgi:hypothetical protein